MVKTARFLYQTSWSKLLDILCLSFLICKVDFCVRLLSGVNEGIHTEHLELCLAYDKFSLRLRYYNYLLVWIYGYKENVIAMNR